MNTTTNSKTSLTFLVTALVSAVWAALLAILQGAGVIISADLATTLAIQLPGIAGLVVSLVLMVRARGADHERALELAHARAELPPGAVASDSGALASMETEPRPAVEG